MTALRQRPAPNVSGPLELWQSVIDPGGIGMPEAIAADLAAFRSEPVASVLDRMAHGVDDFKELWVSSRVDTGNPESIAAFYREQFTEAYELANWHAGRAGGPPPLNYARAALLARKKGLTRVLDFGSGIGTGSLCFAALGCEVHSADIAQELLRLVNFRMARHGFLPRPIDLAAGERPREGYFDLITCFDVLEHVPNQLEKLRELTRYLKIGGYLIVNLMIDSYDPNRPMHVSSAGDWLSLIRRTSLVPDWAAFDSPTQVLVRRRFGAARNAIGRCVDLAQRATGARLISQSGY